MVCWVRRKKGTRGQEEQLRKTERGGGDGSGNGLGVVGGEPLILTRARDSSKLAE